VIWSLSRLHHLTLAGLLLFAASVPAADDGLATLGRLFSTPEERARIDEARRRARLPPAPVVQPEAELVEQEELAEPAPPPAPPPRGSLTVDGYVLRGQGPATVWVNGETSPGGPLLGTDATVMPPRRHGEGAYIETADGARALLRPGQVLPEGDDRVQEAWLLPPMDAGAAAGGPERARSDAPTSNRRAAPPTGGASMGAGRR
jgi:hypothetical protein